MTNCFVVSCLLLLFCGAIWGKERCCPDDKCYTNSYPFDNMPLPQCRDSVQPTMRLYTQSNPDTSQVITRTTIPPAFREGKPVVFIAHGFLNWKEIWWMGDIKDAFLRKYDYNVIIASWSRGAIKIDYTQAASNTRVAGAEIGYVARHLVERGVANRNETWCTGHSLGSHVCGHAGQNYKFGRVTGMDPAGPWFQDKDWSVGINPSVADFVDIWHTNGDTALIMGFGTLKKLGHVDYYPNGGGFQKGCVIDPYTMNETRPEHMVASPYNIDLMPFCSHLRAFVYFRESIESECQMYARHWCNDESNIPASCFPCSDTEDGICGLMGMDADKYETAYKGFPLHLTTNGGKPYCVG